MKSQMNVSGRLEMIAAMALSGTIGYFVVESGQGVWNVVFFRCLFGALSLFAYCSAKGMLARFSALSLHGNPHGSMMSTGTPRQAPRRRIVPTLPAWSG